MTSEKKLQETKKKETQDLVIKKVWKSVSKLTAEEIKDYNAKIWFKITNADGEVVATTVGEKERFTGSYNFGTFKAKNYPVSFANASADGCFTLNPETSELIIHDMPVGTYTITEYIEGIHNYTPVKKTATVTLSQGSNPVVFTVTNKENKKNGAIVLLLLLLLGIIGGAAYGITSLPSADMTAESSETEDALPETKEETESTTTEAATEKLETPATEQTTPKPSETEATAPAETTTTTTTAAATPQSTETSTTATVPTEATTPKPSTTTTTTTAATPQSTEAPAPEWTETAVSGTKYVTVDCYSRKKAVLGATTVKLYKTNTEVKVVAKTNTGYFKLENGSFIHGDYLSDNKVVITTTTTTKPVETKPAIEPFMVYCAVEPSCSLYANAELTEYGSAGQPFGYTSIVVEVNEDKGSYKFDNGYYAKISDYSTTCPVPEMYQHPYENLEAIKQEIIKNGEALGLKYIPDVKEGGYSQPMTITRSANPVILYKDVKGHIKQDLADNPNMTAFSIKIWEIPYEEAANYWLIYHSYEEWEKDDPLAVAILRG